MKVSLCIPTYNVAERIIITLESLINQTMSSKDYEIIVVDDCSEDNSVELMEQCFKKNNFTNYKIDVLSENSGHASKPRNRSLDLATGEYIYFIDGDDFLYPEALERMYKLGHDNDSDLIIGKYKGINRDVPKDMFRHNAEIIDAEIIEHRLMWGMSILKMFKRSVIEDLQLRFDLEEPVGEDVLFFAHFIANTKRWSIVGNYDCYGVIGHEGVHLSKRVRPIEDYLRTQRKTINAFSEGHAFTNDQKLRAYAKYYTRILKHGKYPSFYKYSVNLDIEEKQKWLKALSEFTKEYIPYEAIKYINDCDKNIFVAVREENLLALSLADNIETLKTNSNKRIKNLEVENKKLHSKLSSLEERLSKLENKKSIKKNIFS